LRSGIALLGAWLGVLGCTPLKAGTDRASSVTEAGSDSLSVCAHRLPPALPPAPPARPDVDASDASLPDLVFAMSSIYYGVGSTDDAGLPAYQDVGFDLDDTCTGWGQGSSCAEPPSATASHRDGPGGVDNAAGQLKLALSPVPLADPMDVTSANAEELVFGVSSYSGEPDDDQVEVSLYVAFGLTRADGQMGPVWDGNDAWTILPEMLAPLPDGGSGPLDVHQARYRDPAAYVAGGVLVAHLGGALWPAGLLLDPTYLSPVARVTLAGRLVRVGAAWELQDLMTGVVARAPDFLAAAARWPLQTGSAEPYCQSAASYATLKTFICSFVDISSTSTSPQAPCDAMSGGSRLTAKQALLGAIAPPTPPLQPCAPGIDPEADTCETPGD
jgi:hypothetical protein